MKTENGSNSNNFFFGCRSLVGLGGCVLDLHGLLSYCKTDLFFFIRMFSLSGPGFVVTKVTFLPIFPHSTL